LQREKWWMHAHRLVFYATLLPNLNLVEWYAVTEHVGGGSDLWDSGASEPLKLSSDLADSSAHWVELRMEEASPSSNLTSD
jgi:hypothetical protein